MDEHRDHDAQPSGICDASDLCSWLLKGTGAEPWLVSRVTHVPGKIYETTTLDGGRLTRTGADEFLIELTHDAADSWPRTFDIKEGELPGFHVFERQDAVFCLVGETAGPVMAQTCGINWNEVPAETLTMTRVAGVSCGVRPTNFSQIDGFVIRVDPTYAVYLWDQLRTICEELGAGVLDRSVL